MGEPESAEISLAQLFAESDSFENLCTAIRADSGNPHLTHDFEQTFADRFDIVFLSGSIVQLNIFLFYQLVEVANAIYGFSALAPKPSSKAACITSRISPALYNQCCLHTFADRYQMVMHGTYCQ